MLGQCCPEPLHGDLAKRSFGDFLLMLMLLRNGAKIWSLNELMCIKAMSGGNDWGVPEA